MKKLLLFETRLHRGLSNCSIYAPTFVHISALIIKDVEISNWKLVRVDIESLA